VFYGKIQVPLPTFCPECRMKRRMVWRNERSLYKRKCDAPNHKEEIISMYANGSSIKVWDQKFWQEDNRNPLDYGKEYDFGRPFFEQLENLLTNVSFPNLNGSGNINSDYCNWLHNSNNCYYVFGGSGNENILYSGHVADSKDSMDLYTIVKLELSYDCSFCQNSYRLFFGQNCENCMDSYFLYDCRNCSECFGCAGLRNKQYYIFNQPYAKEEYKKKIQQFNLGSFRSFIELKNKFNKQKLKIPHKFVNSIRAINSTGDNIIDANNCKYVFDIFVGGAENSKYSFRIGKNTKDVYDCSCYFNCELMYENFSVGIDAFKVFFSVFVWTGSEIQYSVNCHSSHYLFACVGLRNKQYCILNKQYTKEEYEELVPKIIKHMNDMPYISRKSQILNPKLQINSNNQNSKTQAREIIYRYGEFFPPELSPFAYNETVAQEYFSLTKEQAINKGYQWKDPETKNYQITLKTEQIPDHIKDVKDSITDEIIECSNASAQGGQSSQCSTAFKIIYRELEFYRKNNIPIPRLCPNCRHYQRIKQRNPLRLWRRKCQCAGTHSDNKVYQNTIKHNHHDNNHCPNEFETTYAPERKEIVYCEKCYQEEVV